MRLKFLPSFAKRRGRITKSQEENLKLLPNFSIKALIDIQKAALDFKYCCLEIGFGNADSIGRDALNNPEILFVGSEVYMSGIGSLLRIIKDNNINNVKIFSDDIRLLLDTKDPIETFDAIKIICPDPWPKERHHKRRLINNSFLELLHRSMKQKANLYISTDWENYADSINETLDKSSLFDESKSIFLEKKRLTKFEERGQNEGRDIFEFNYQKGSHPS